MIRVTDQQSDGKETSIVLTKGGPGFQFANIKIESQRFCGFNVIVEVFGV